MNRNVVAFLVSTALVASATAASAHTYIVKPGDTLYGIARQHAMTVDQIKQWNGLTSDNIWAGQSLSLAGPAATATTTNESTEPRASALKAVVVADRLNVRDKGDLTGNVIGGFQRGEVVEILEKGEHWSLARHGQQTGYVANEFLRFGGSAPIASRASDLMEQRLHNIVQSLVGAPYRAGGTSPSGFDCSGFTMYVMGQLGVKLPRVSADQFHVGVPVDRENLQPGDLLFFDSYKSGKITHVSIYLGNNKIAHAASRGVVIEDATWYFNHYPYYGAKRALR